MAEIGTYVNQFSTVFARNPQLSNIKPSEWAEKHVVLPGNKGRVDYTFNPYCREIIDCFAPDHPARKIAVMKGSQITFSSGVLIPLLGYIISEDPHNTYMMVGTTELIKPAVEKIDFMIDKAGLKDLIGYQIQRKKNNKSGDTDEIKHFPLGYVKIGSASNPKSVAQVDLERILLDDFDAMKGQSKEAGSFVDLIEMRAAASMNTYKLGMISTPLLKGSSNIEAAFEMGDRRRYFIDCPCCHKPIILKWVVPEGMLINPLAEEAVKGSGTADGTGGIHYETNNHGQVINKSVGYVCYRCAGFFKDNDKRRMLNEAVWTPTVVARGGADYRSYHISSLYAPPGMFNWAYYAAKQEAAAPRDNSRPRDEYKIQVLMNTRDGETYEAQSETVKATAIMGNTQPYNPGTVPDELSVRQGNGRVVMLTFACDCNGTVAGVNGAVEHDARVDYEIIAHTESGTTYSVLHGSVGTFVPRERSKAEKAERHKWTYELNKPNSVWPVVYEIAKRAYVGESGLLYIANSPGVDVGVYSDLVEKFIDWTIGKDPANPFIGMRGKKEEVYMRDKQNVSLFERGKVRNDVYYLQVGMFKDLNASYMRLEWDPVNDDHQPGNFMNFPTPTDGLYGYPNFFQHFEAEKRKEVTNNDGTRSFRWEKVNSSAQNHHLDCRIYNLAIKEIILKSVAEIARKEGQKEFTWVDFCKYVLNS